MAKDLVQYLGTGRRKSSVARVILTPPGTGKFIVNGREFEEFYSFSCNTFRRSTTIRIN